VSTRPLKFGEIKKLIELCRGAGVSEIALGDMRIVFGGQTKDAPQTASSFQTKETEVQTQQIEMEALRDSSKELDERDLSIMQVEDPSRYEQMLIEGELEDDGSGGEFGDADRGSNVFDAEARAERAQAPLYQ
jgi:hypothetical protein